MITPEKKQELLDTLESHFQTYLWARSLTSYMNESILNNHNGCIVNPSPPLYNGYGYSNCVIFPADLFKTKDDLRLYQDIGYWINQSFLIEVKCIISTFIKDLKNSPLKDSKHFKLLTNCRNLFAHQSYKLNYRFKDGSKKSEIKKIKKLYFELFSNAGELENRKLNLSIDVFVIPLYEEIIKQIKEKF